MLTTFSGTVGGQLRQVSLYYYYYYYCYYLLNYLFGPKRDEVTREKRTLHNEELNDLYPSLNIFRMIKSRRMICTGQVACVWERRGVYRVLLGKPEGNRPIRSPRHRLEDNIKVDLEEMGCGGMDLIDLALERAR
jgi:hypothetical protein